MTERTCRRCNGRYEHVGMSPEHLCEDCSPLTVTQHLGRRLAELSLRVEGARALIRLGHYTAAALVLAGAPDWPTLAQARALQRREGEGEGG